MMSTVKKYFNELAEAFRKENGFHIGLILTFCLVNGLVFFNACFHDPTIGYDTDAHLRYIQALSEGRLVSPDDSYEFFCPPLPYAIPALSVAAGLDILSAAKLAQFLNFFLSLGTTLLLLKTCHWLTPRPSLKLGSLVFMGIMPVYYKTFAFVRGEPYVVFFAALILHLIVKMLVTGKFTTANSIVLGGAMGLCALSRQWGIFLFPAVFALLGILWIISRLQRKAIRNTIGICLVLVPLVAGWFYLSMVTRFGSVTAFNGPPHERFSFNNQPKDFYLGLGLKDVFREPVRPHFANQFFPIFYSELWGDYWCYFTIYARDTRTRRFVNGYLLNRMIILGGFPDWMETNYNAAAAYLGRVNLVALFPTLTGLAAVIAAMIWIFRKTDRDALSPNRRMIYAFLLLAIFSTMAGYLWFLIRYPSEKGITIKATYVLQVLPFTSILAGALLERIGTRSLLAHRLVLGGLYLSLLHNLGAMITHYR